MPLAENDDMIKQIPAATANPAFRNAVLPRTSVAGPLRLDAEAHHSFDHFVVELWPSIKDQLTWRRVVGESLPQLLNNPSAGRMLCHIALKDAPPVMRNDEEAIEHTERERRHGEEVHRCDGLTVVAQERRPVSCRLRIPRRFPHPAQHGSFRDIESKHFQFAMNARGAPSRVLSDHPKDEFAPLFADALSPRAGSMP